VSVKPFAQIIGQPFIETFDVDLALQDVNVEELGHFGFPSRSSREKWSKPKKVSAFATASVRQSSLLSTTRA
jgi:hypothetical protein